MSGEAEAQRDFTKERDEHVIPAARELLKMLVTRDDLQMGSSASITADSAATYYQKVYQECVVPVLRKHNLKLKDIPFMFSIMLQPIQLLNDITTSSFEMNRDLSDALKYGLSDIGDLDVLGLDSALKEAAENRKAKSEERPVLFHSDTVYYGPQPCKKCGEMIVTSSKESGAHEFDAIIDKGEYFYPSTAPDLAWKKHVHKKAVDKPKRAKKKSV